MICTVRSYLAYLALLVIVAFCVSVAVIADRQGHQHSATLQAGTGTSQFLIRPNAHRLADSPGGQVTFVDFIDMESEVSSALLPTLRRLRTQFSGRVTFVVRHFPTSTHPNSTRASRAVEAAGKQGRFDAMLFRLLESQSSWTGTDPQTAEAMFRRFATSLRLDLGAYDAAYNSPDTAAKIDGDIQDGQRMGVEAMPAYFVNGNRIRPRTYDDLANAIDVSLCAQRQLPLPCN